MNFPIQNVYLGLGSNLNNPKKQLKNALLYLSQLPRTQFCEKSVLYRSPPWGFTHQPDFINAAVHITTQLTPPDLLFHLKKIEYQQMKRKTTPRWHQRIIDIDILFYANSSYRTPELTIPHPHIYQRCFVLIPLLDINPKLEKNTLKKITESVKSLGCEKKLLPAGSW